MTGKGLLLLLVMFLLLVAAGFVGAYAGESLNELIRWIIS